MADDTGRVGETNSTGRNYRDLLVWQKAMDLAECVYQITRNLPVDERFGLVSQMRRCAVSIPSNIAEGQGRRTDGDLIRVCQIAHGSLRELETQLELCSRLGYLEDPDTHASLRLAAEVGRLLSGLIRSKRKT